jgi:hypothetical protein
MDATANEWMDDATAIKYGRHLATCVLCGHVASHGQECNGLGTIGQLGPAVYMAVLAFANARLQGADFWED